MAAMRDKPDLRVCGYCWRSIPSRLRQAMFRVAAPIFNPFIQMRSAKKTKS